MGDVWRKIMALGSYVRWRMVCVCKWAERLALLVSKEQSEFPELYALSKEDLCILLRCRRGLIWRIQQSRDVHLVARCGLPKSHARTLAYHLRWVMPQTFSFSVNNAICGWITAGKLEFCRKTLRGANREFLGVLDEVTKIKLMQIGFAIFLAHNTQIYQVAIYSRLLAACSSPEAFEDAVDSNNGPMALAVTYVLDRTDLMPIVTRKAIISWRDHLILACRTANITMLRKIIASNVTWGDMDAVILYTTNRAVYLELLPLLPKEAIHSPLLWPAVGAEGDIETMAAIMAAPYDVKPNVFLSEACANHRLKAIAWLIARGANRCTNCRNKLCCLRYSGSEIQPP